MNKIFEMLDEIGVLVNESELTELDKVCTLQELRDLKQEIYDRFTITSKANENENE